MEIEHAALPTRPIILNKNTTFPPDFALLLIVIQSSEMLTKSGEYSLL